LQQIKGSSGGEGKEEGLAHGELSVHRLCSRRLTVWLQQRISHKGEKSSLVNTNGNGPTSIHSLISASQAQLGGKKLPDWY